jgi:Protein of unknown function (DUF2442)
MRSEKPGSGTLQAEVVNISEAGFWICVNDRRLFLPFREFPWFEDQPVARIRNIERPRPDHLHWPDLDIDLSIESIEHPDRFPMISRS